MMEKPNELPPVRRLLPGRPYAGHQEDFQPTGVAIMSRQFDAKHAALKAYPTDREAGIKLFLGYLDASEKDFIYEEGMTPVDYIYGKALLNNET